MKKQTADLKRRKYHVNLNKLNKGFTLIELLVVISIIGVIIGLSIFGLQGAREASRDSKRKADLESLRSGLEIFRSDCNSYPLSVTPTAPENAFGSVLRGDDSNPSCLSTNTYMSQIPKDPVTPARSYLYWSDGVTYEVCTALEQDVAVAETCGGSSSCGVNCNYKAVNP